MLKERVKDAVLAIQQQWQMKLSLLKTLVQRDLEARYKGSVLGNLWPLVLQLSQLLIYTYVFSIVLRVRPGARGIDVEGPFGFGLWLFAGLVPWLAFTSGFSRAASAVIRQPNLVKKVVFPLVLLPLVPVLSSFLEGLFGLGALIIMVAFALNSVQGTLFLLPLVWIPQILITAGLGYLAASLTVFLRDIPQTVGVILNLWFYLTPIVYPISVVPEKFRQWVLWLNPLATLAEMNRDVVLTGEVTHWRDWGITVVMSLLVFYAGVSIYRRLRPAFADVL